MSTPVTPVFQNFVVFGDSLSDPGNLFEASGGVVPSPPYAQRFSNGPVWAEQLSEHGALGLPEGVVQNYAFGNARAVGTQEVAPGLDINLTAQVDSFLEDFDAGDFGGEIAATFFIGINDFATTLFETSPLALLLNGEEIIGDLIDDVLLSIGDQARRVVDEAGVGEIVLFNLLDALQLPIATALSDVQALNPDQPFIPSSYRPLVAKIEEEINAGIAQLALDLSTPGAEPAPDVTLVDINFVQGEIFDDPGTFGFGTVDTPVYVGTGEELGPQTNVLDEFSEDAVAWWDVVHPTTAQHGVWAAYVSEVLEAREVVLGGPGFDDVFTTQGTDLIMASGGDDIVRARGDADVAFGGLGDDRLFGNNGSDLLVGGEGNDRVWGQKKDDVLFGNVGDDRMGGGGGRDVLFGGPGSDKMWGGRWDDRFLIERDGTTTGEFDWIDGGRGNDVILLGLASELAGADFASELAAWLATPAGSSFTFESIGLEVINVEEIVVSVDEPVDLGAGSAGVVSDDVLDRLAEADLWGVLG